MASTISPRAPGLPGDALRAHWPMLLGALALVAPTLVRLARQVWTTEMGIYGPIVLATGLWLILRERDALRLAARRGSTTRALFVLVPVLIIYVFGRAFDYLSLEVAAAIAVLVTIAYCLFGWAVIRRMWFPIFYLCFMIPLPGWFVDTITAPLKTFVSYGSAALLRAAGYPVAREGVTLFVSQYSLLVEDACAGLNSLISLTAISLFYIYLLHNATVRYSLLLMLWIVPLAILANIIRIILLVLITYYLGNEAAQGFLHSSAGLVMFATALIGIFVVDHLMSAFHARFIARRPA